MHKSQSFGMVKIYIYYKKVILYNATSDNWKKIVSSDSLGLILWLIGKILILKNDVKIKLAKKDKITH